VTTSAYSAVIQKFDFVDSKAEDPNSCLSNYYTDMISTLPALNVVDPDDSVLVLDANADLAEEAFSYYYTPSYFNLQPQLYLYWEQKLFPEQISF